MMDRNVPVCGAVHPGYPGMDPDEHYCTRSGEHSMHACRHDDCLSGWWTDGLSDKSVQPWSGSIPPQGAAVAGKAALGPILRSLDALSSDIASLREEVLGLLGDK